MVELFADEPFTFEPGSDWRYNNSGYYLLGMIIEALSEPPVVSDGGVESEGRGVFGSRPALGRRSDARLPGAAPGPSQEALSVSFADYLVEHVFGPLGMTGSSYCDESAIVPHRAQGYEVDDGALVNDRPISMNLPGAAGALCSNVLDLLRWQRALDKNTLITPASRELMLTEATLEDGSGTGYGYGLFMNEFEGRPKGIARGRHQRVFDDAGHLSGRRSGDHRAGQHGRGAGPGSWKNRSPGSRWASPSRSPSTCRSKTWTWTATRAPTSSAASTSSPTCRSVRGNCGSPHRASASSASSTREASVSRSCQVRASNSVWMTRQPVPRYSPAASRSPE